MLNSLQDAVGMENHPRSRKTDSNSMNGIIKEAAIKGNADSVVKVCLSSS